MITVKFFGLLNVDSNVKQLTLNSGKLNKIIEEILIACPNLTKKQLLQSIMFVNKKQIASKKRLHMQLNDGDEIAFISPSSGG